MKFVKLFFSVSRKFGQSLFKERIWRSTPAKRIYSDFGGYGVPFFFRVSAANNDSHLHKSLGSELYNSSSGTGSPSDRLSFRLLFQS